MIYFNNEFTIDDSICSNRGFNYGIGCFETLMGIGRKVIFLEEHLKRLENSMKYLGIEKKHDWYGIIRELIKFENIKEKDEYSIKILINDTDCLVNLKRIKLRDEPDGIKVKMIRELYQNEFGFIKSISYAQNIITMEKIRREGFYEGIFKNRLGFVTEGTISNIFFVKNNKIFTPEKSLNILPGIVRDKIILIAQKLKLDIIEGKFTEEEVINSDSLFITNSLMKKGILWINEIEGVKKIKGNIENEIEKKYLEIIKI